MIIKNSGEVNTDNYINETKNLLNWFEEQLTDEQKATMDKKKAEQLFLATCDESNLFKVLDHTAKSKRFWTEINSTEISIPWLDLDGQVSRMHYMAEDIQPHNEELLFSDESVKLVKEIGMLKFDECDAVKILVTSKGAELLASIKYWSKTNIEDPWREEAGGIDLTPADLLALAELVNQAIHYFFSRKHPDVDNPIEADSV